MKEDSSTRSWNRLGDEWFALAAGESRMQFIMPYMFGLLGNVNGLRILDLGCGKGGYARELAKQGADVTAVDCSVPAIAYAEGQAQVDGLIIQHLVRNSNDLHGLADNWFDVIICSMMLMDCEDLKGTIGEAARVLKPSGRLHASVLHPCFNGEHEKGIGRQGQHPHREVVVKDYFHPTEWEAPLPGGETNVLWRHRTLEEYVKAFVQCGLVIVDLNEARPSPQQAEASDAMAWLLKIPLYLYFTLNK